MNSLYYYPMFINIEIKAHCHDPRKIRTYLQFNQAKFIGIDEQTDTYFNCLSGRLKLREGNIENNLIFYDRANSSGPKASYFQLLKVEDPSGLKSILASTNGIRVIVKKKREIYFIDNVKFHIDTVPGLGHFMEIEAGNKTHPEMTEMELQEQCARFMNELGIRTEDLIDRSYSDMLADDNGTQVAG